MILDAGYRIPDIGYQILDSNYRIIFQNSELQDFMTSELLNFSIYPAELAYLYCSMPGEKGRADKRSQK
jgi:hypothetical protein